MTEPEKKAISDPNAAAAGNSLLSGMSDEALVAHLIDLFEFVDVDSSGAIEWDE